MVKFGFIGMGNMGSAMARALLKNLDAKEIGFTEPDKEKLKAFAALTGIHTFEDNVVCAKNSRYIILAVKPIVYPKVLEQIKDVLDDSHVIISIAPGILISSIAQQIDNRCRIVRAMPNTPAMIGEGMTGVCYEESAFNAEERGEIEGFFKSFGRVCLVQERLMSAVVCASGSSPAYVYMFMEALADSVVKCGMPRNMAYEFVAQTVLGSAKMLLETGEHPGKLKDDVCSPAGTTIAAVEQLEANGFRNSLFQATDACYKKCEGIQ